MNFNSVCFQTFKFWNFLKQLKDLLWLLSDCRSLGHSSDREFPEQWFVERLLSTGLLRHVVW